MHVVCGRTSIDPPLATYVLPFFCGRRHFLIMGPMAMGTIRGASSKWLTHRHGFYTKTRKLNNYSKWFARGQHRIGAESDIYDCLVACLCLPLQREDGRSEWNNAAVELRVVGRLVGWLVDLRFNVPSRVRRPVLHRKWKYGRTGRWLKRVSNWTELNWTEANLLASTEDELRVD